MMNIASLSLLSPAGQPHGLEQRPEAAAGSPQAANNKPQLREAFDDFVGQSLFGQVLSSMRKTLDKPAYFHGGRAEEVFQGQLDQMLAEELSEASAERFTGPMFELFQLSRSQ